jgi:hypothetical protein
MDRPKLWSFTLPKFFAEQILYAPHCLNIADLAEIPLVRPKVGVSQNEFADKLNRNT